MAREPVVMHLAAGGATARVVGVERGTVFAEAPIPVGSGAPVRLGFRQGDLAAAIDVEVEAAGASEAGRPGVGYRILGPRNALVVLGRIASGEGKDRFAAVLGLEVPPRPARDGRGGRDRRLVAAFAAAALLFGAVAAWQVDRRLFTFDAEIARVASDGAVVRADKAGRLVFVTGRERVAAGEPVAGVRTRSGFEQPFLAPRDGRVSAILARGGDTLAVGDPVLVVSPPGEIPYVVARIRTEDAVRLARGYDAVVTFADGETRRVPVAPSDVVPLGGGASTARVDVRIDAGGDLAARVGEPARVRFVATGGRPADAVRLASLDRPAGTGDAR